MSTISGDKFADILDIENDHEHLCGRNNFQVQILVTPLQCEEGGTEITVSGGNLSRGSVEKLPQIHNFQETQWITRRIERVTSNDQLLGARIACNQQKHSPSRNKTNRSPIRKYDVDGCQSGMPSTQEETVARYLRAHPDFLERFVTEEVDPERLERWIIRRSQRVKQQDAVQRKTSLSKWKFCVHADKRKMLQELTRSLQQDPTRDRVLWELARCVCSAVDADEFRLYLVERDELVYYKGGTPDGETTVDDDLSEENDVSRQIAERVCRTKEPVRVSQRFPTQKGNVDHILCQPVIQSNGDLTAILELRRREPHEKFHEEDEEIALSYLVWGGIALHYAHLYGNMNQQRKLNDFLLAVVKCIFQDMVSMDALVMKIMNFAQELVDADRASLFLVDTRSQELYATIFDVGKDSQHKEQVIEGEDAKEIRFALGTGIAGQVALTGEILNIADAYADSRFNRAVDQITGYKTHTILCMPIFKGKGSIIGVVQMVNKRFGNFTKDDEEAFEMFAVYCGLALHHAKLYDTIKKSEQKYRVALEVLSYHNTCTEEEFQDALQVGVPAEPIGLDDYYFNPFELRDAEKARYAISMFIDLFGLNRFDKNSLLRFTLTVRKNYRRVPYHNWTHGFSVAHCMYAMIKQAKDVFRPNECLALYIGALCHDLDHRGKNNKFMLDTESPLANIYSTSTMEHHHFNQTVTILQQQGHNIFSKLSSVEYKQVLSLLKHCILATDLALFFPNKARLNELVKSDAFSWTNQEHRLLIQAIAMTGSDLSASAKPWEVQVKTVDIIFQEFYDQGDAERAAGRTPIPMMDRNQPEQQPASQVGFLMGICSPCYELLYKLIPQTKGLLDMCEENLTKWKRIDEDIKNGA